jgi:hypothetical protein
MRQPAPTVSQADVEKIIKRDYPADKYDQIMSMLNTYGTEDWQREPQRVRLSVLKLANGNIDELRRYIEWAKCDYRDVISPVEYPMATKKIFRMDKLTKEEIESIYKKDWEQYQKWIDRE